MNIDNHRALARGQVWQTRAAHIEIVALGKSFIHYRISRQLGRPGISAQISGIHPMAEYLRRNAAKLVRGAARN